MSTLPPIGSRVRVPWASEPWRARLSIPTTPDSASRSSSWSSSRAATSRSLPLSALTPWNSQRSLARARSSDYPGSRPAFAPYRVSCIQHLTWWDPRSASDKIRNACLTQSL